MNVYIDLGCYNGDSVLQFRNWRLLKYAPEIKWMTHAFDPNPSFKKEWKQHARPDTKFYQKAAWIEDGEIDYTLNPLPESSTVMKEKQDWGKGKVIKVSCFDFSAWLKKFRYDQVIIKMDCEGAELPILTKMIEDGTDDIADITLVEFHDGKMPRYDSNKKEILENYRGKLRVWR